MEIDFQPSLGPALEAAAWFVTSTTAFSVAIHLPMPQRLWLAPAVVLPAYLSFTRVESLEPLVLEFDRLWCFTVVTYTAHVLASLYIEQWKLPLHGRGLPVDFVAAYKIWNNPRRLPPLPQEAEHRAIAESERWAFVAHRATTTLLLWLVDKQIVVRATALLDPTPEDFAPERQSYLPQLATLSTRETLLRLFVSVSWVWYAYLALTTANAAAAALFVAVLRLDAPGEWPPLFGDSREAYSLRRFWAVFWHRILQPPHAAYARILAAWAAGFTCLPAFMKNHLKPGSQGYKAFVALCLFAAAAASHTLVNWQTGAFGPVLGDARFLMLNFLGAFIEAWVCHALGPRLRPALPSVLIRGIGHAWVLGFFYFTVPPWQFAVVYDGL